jgi:hydroxyacylglutathione hydrolase
VAEPDNADIAAKIDRVAAMRGRGEFTTPSMIGEVRATNPFLRAGSADEFGARRKRKDDFK